MSSSMLPIMTNSGSDFYESENSPSKTRRALHVRELGIDIPEAIFPNYPSHVHHDSQMQYPSTLLAESPFKARYKAAYRSKCTT